MTGTPEAGQPDDGDNSKFGHIEIDGKKIAIGASGILAAAFGAVLAHQLMKDHQKRSGEESTDNS